jgi:Flp pilus assembly protein TadD
MSKRKPKKGVKSKAVSSASERPGLLFNTRLVGILLFALGFLLYANTLSHDYALDDAIVIYDNEFTQQGLSGVDDLLRYDTFRGFFKVEGKDKLVSGGRYRPWTPILFALQVQFFGLNPMVGHFFNAFFYGLTGLLIYVLLLQLLRVRFARGFTHWVALFTALIFLTHPLHTEVVANIKGADEMWALLGGLGALWASLKAVDEEKPLWHLAAAVFFFIGLLSKENAITLVVLVPLAYWFFRQTSLLKIAGSTLPFVVVAGIFLVLRTSVLGFSLGEPSGELMNNPFLKLVGNQYVPLSADEKFATILFTLGKYLQLMVFPHPLTHDYYPRHIEIMRFADWQVLLSGLAYVGLVVVAVIGLVRRTVVGFGVIFFLVTLSIVSNLVFPIGTNMSERFMYLPSLGLILALTAFLFSLDAGKQAATQGTALEQLRLVTIALVLVAVIFSVRTMYRNLSWKDNYTLFTTDVETAPNSAKLRNSTGGEMIAHAIKVEDALLRERELREAVGHLKEAIRIHPYYKNAYLLLGNAHNYLQEYEAAIGFYERALELDPNYPDAKNNLGLTYRDAGKFFGEQQGNLAKAESYLLQAYTMRPDDYEVVRLLGVAYGMQQKHGDAIQFFERGTQLKPNDADAWFNLAIAHYNAGNAEKGAEFEAKAKAIDPNVLQKRQGG